MVFIEVRSEEHYTLYDLLVEIIPYPEPGEISIIGTGLLHDEIYDQTLGIPALKLEILNNAGNIQLNRLRTYYNGTDPLQLRGIEVWLDDGDHVLRQPLGEHLLRSLSRFGGQVGDGLGCGQADVAILDGHAQGGQSLRRYVDEQGALIVAQVGSG